MSQSRMSCEFFSSVCTTCCALRAGDSVFWIRLPCTTPSGRQARGPDQTLPRSRDDHYADTKREESSQLAERLPWLRRCDGAYCRCCDGWTDRYWRLVGAGLRDGGAFHVHTSNSQTSFRRRHGGSPGAPCQFRIGAPRGVKTSRRLRRPECFYEVAECTGAGVALRSLREIVRVTNHWLPLDLMHDDDSDDGMCIDD